MCILSAEKFFEIELCQKTRISLIKLYDKYLPFCNFYALVSHAIFFSRKTHSQKSKKKCLKVGIVSSRSRWAYVSTVLKDSNNDFSAAETQHMIGMEAWPARNKTRKKFQTLILMYLIFVYLLNFCKVELDKSIYFGHHILNENKFLII